MGHAGEAIATWDNTGRGKEGGPGGYVFLYFCVLSTLLFSSHQSSFFLIISFCGVALILYLMLYLFICVTSVNNFQASCLQISSNRFYVYDFL